MELTLVGSETSYPLLKTLSLINRSTKRAQRLANQRFFPFKTSGRKCDIECPIHGIINSCEIEGVYLGRVLSIFLTKQKIHNDFFWKKTKQNKTKTKKHFSKFERWINTCFIVAVFRFFTILCFLKNRHNPWWSVTTLDQYRSEKKILTQHYLNRKKHWPICFFSW